MISSKAKAQKERWKIDPLFAKRPGLGMLRPIVRPAPGRLRSPRYRDLRRTSRVGITAYADRWQVETLFGGLKTRGFNFEDTHLKDAHRLSNMMGLLALAFAWAHRTGKQLHDNERPIPKKPFGDPSVPSSATASTFCATSPSTSPRNFRISCAL